MLPKRTKQRVVIECGGAHVSVGVVSFGGKAREAGGAARHLRIDAFGREDFVCPPEHTAAWAAQVGAALETLWARLELVRAGECRLAVPGHLALTKLVKTPAVAADEIPQVLRFEAGQAIPFPLDQVVWGGVVTANDGEEMGLLVSAAKLDAVEPLCAAVESARLSPTYCEPAALALWRGLSQSVRDPVLVVDVGARSTQVIIGGSGALPYLRTLNFGGNTVTGSLAQRLGCGFAEAEAAKRKALRSLEEPAPPRESELLLGEALSQATRAFAQKLGSELLLTRLAYLRQSGAISPTRLFLCGGGSVLPSLHEAIAETLSLPVDALPPTASSEMELTPSLVGKGTLAASDWYTLYGLALGAVMPETQQLNLLPPSRSAAVEMRARRRWWLAAAAVLALLPLPLLIQQRSAISALHARTATVDAKLAPLMQLSADNAHAQAKVNALRERLGVLDRLNTQQESWLAFLADLQMRLSQVGDVWLERLHYNATSSRYADEVDATAPAAVEVGGWLLDGAHADEAIHRLFESLQASDFVQGIERERYDRSRAGLIRFDAELLIAPEKSL